MVRIAAESPCRAVNLTHVPSLTILQFVGMTTALQMTVFLNSTVIFGPTDRPATADVVSQVLAHARLDGIIVPPSVLEDLCRDDETLKQVKDLKYVHFAGAPLRKDVGDIIAKDVHLVSFIGSTEAGPWFPRVRNYVAWSYASFMKGTGIDFEPRNDSLYELVFRRREEYKRWQLIFDVYPNLDVFRTKDLFIKHPIEDDLWEYAGRADDIVTLSSGLDLYAAKLERTIEAHPRVRCALVGGVGRQSPFLIVEFTELIAEDSARSHALLSSSEEQDRIDEIWTVVEEANKSCVASVRLTIGLTAVASVGKSLPRTSKGTVARRAAELLYKEQIVDMYAR